MWFICVEPKIQSYSEHILHNLLDIIIDMQFPKG